MRNFVQSYSADFEEVRWYVAYHVNELLKLYPGNAMNDIKSYVIHLCRHVMDIADSAAMIINKGNDFISANTLVRAMADHLTAIIFIYDRLEYWEIEVRHYLYVLDGVATNLRYLKAREPEFNPAVISIEEFNDIKRGIEDAICNRETAERYCKLMVKSILSGKAPESSIESLINKHNWQFVDLLKLEGKLKWESMYSCLGLKTTDMFSFMSQFVHGLSISNLTVSPDDLQCFNNLYSFLIALIGRLEQFLKTFYKDDMPSITRKQAEDLISNLLNSPDGRIVRWDCPQASAAGDDAGGCDD